MQLSTTHPYSRPFLRLPDSYCCSSKLMPQLSVQLADFHNRFTLVLLKKKVLADTEVPGMLSVSGIH